MKEDFRQDFCTSLTLRNHKIPLSVGIEICTIRRLSKYYLFNGTKSFGLLVGIRHGTSNNITKLESFELRGRYALV